jgi:hypothetical protein
MTGSAVAVAVETDGKRKEVKISKTVGMFIPKSLYQVLGNRI